MEKIKIYKKIFLKIFIILFLFSFVVIIIGRIIYYSSNINNKNIKFDNSFINTTNSYLYYSNYEPNPDIYNIIDWKKEDKLIYSTAETNIKFLYPYYDDKGEIAFSILSKDTSIPDQINFYNIEKYNNIYDLSDVFLNAYFNEESKYSINHEYIYKKDFNNGYYFIIDNVNGGSGKDSSNNGGLGDPSIQQIDMVDENNNNQKTISIATDLLNYKYDDWYDNTSGEYYRTIMPTNDFFHFNSIDYYDKNIYANSRSTGSIISIQILDDNGNFLNEPILNWIYSGNYDTYYYLYPSDLNGNHSIIYNKEEEKYVANPKYNAQETYNNHKENNGLQNKFINWEINGNYYSTDDLNSLRKIENEEKNQLFMGEHCVKILNPYIEELGSENFFLGSSAYDPNDLYFSIFDNHAEWGDTNLELQEYLYNENWYQDDPNSYIKILEVNPNNYISNTNLPPMTGRTIFNHPINKSLIISSAFFFNENNINYLAVDIGTKGYLTIYEFDKIDTKNKDFNNGRIVYYKNLNTDMLYRAYPIWKNLDDDNVIVSWDG